MISKEFDEITDKQQQVYDFYYKDKLTQKQIALRLQISQQAVSKLLKKADLKKSSAPITHTPKIETTTVVNRGLYKNKVWRYHGLQFIIKPFYFYPRYERIRKKRGNYGIQHDQFTIMLHKDSVRIQSRAGTGWRDTDRYKAVLRGETDFNNFLAFAAKTYGFEYQKEGRISIKLVSSELAQEGSDIAQGYNNVTEQNTLTVEGKDGKVWFLIDRSAGLEHEYIGKDTFTNSEQVEQYLNDFLYNNPLTNSQLTSRLSDTITAIEKLKDLNELLFKRINGG